MYRRVVSQVTVLERGPRLAGGEDTDVSDTLREIFEKEQIGLRLNADIAGAEKTGDGVGLRANTGTVYGSHVLIATGRRPNTDDLGLENTGIRMNEHGYIQVDDELRMSSAADVWALGKTATDAAHLRIHLITILKS